MKKIIAVILSLMIMASVLSLTVLAEDKNFLDADSSTFEGGKCGVWKTLALGKGSTEVADNPKGEGKVLRFTIEEKDASKTWSTPAFDLRPILQSKLKEGATVYYQLKAYSDVNASIIATIRDTKNGMSLVETNGFARIGSNSSLDAGEWVTLSGSFDVSDEDISATSGEWYFCFDSFVAKTHTLYIDDVYLSTEEPEDTTHKAEIPAKTAITRSADTLIGTIRWDAYCKSTPNGTSPSSQVARVLSPAKYHCQAPFFANIEADGTVSFPEYNLSVWEQEAQYAIDAGIDYFAYLWYESSDEMSSARKLHLQSPNKDKIKMCGILETIRSEKTMKELYEAMKDSCYLRLNGRPVVFLYGINSHDATVVEELRQGAADAGITEALYVIGMSSEVGKLPLNATKDLDAISWYSIGATKKDETFAELVNDCENTIKNMGEKVASFNLQLVPSFSAGRDSRARIETGVSWVKGDPKATEDKDKPYSNHYALEPSMAELQQHIVNVLTYVKENESVTVPNLVAPMVGMSMRRAAGFARRLRLTKTEISFITMTAQKRLTPSVLMP